MPSVAISQSGNATLVTNVASQGRVLAVLAFHITANAAANVQFIDTASSPNSLTGVMNLAINQSIDGIALPMDPVGGPRYHFKTAPGKDLVLNTTGAIGGWLVYDFVAPGTPGL